MFICVSAVYLNNTTLIRYRNSLLTHPIYMCVLISTLSQSFSFFVFYMESYIGQYTLGPQICSDYHIYRMEKIRIEVYTKIKLMTMELMWYLM